MSDSTSNIDTIATAQASKEVTANAAFNAASPAMLYAMRYTTTTALTWGYYGGRYNGTSIANGTVALTASNTNYVVAHGTTGVVSVSTATTNWNDTATYIRLYLVVAGASTITSYEDHRSSISAPYTLPTATDAVLGGVKVGSGLVINSQVLSTDEAVNPQTGTTYTYLTGDRGKLVHHSNASAIAGTLPQAGGTFASGWWMDVLNSGAGTLTITPVTSTIDGQVSLSLTTGQGVTIVSDGTNYLSIRGAGGYTLPIASAGTLGGIKVGSGLSIDGGGVLSASGSAPATSSLTDFAQDAGTTTGLTYGYQAGRIRDGATTTNVSASTIAMTASTTNYVEVNGAGTVSTNTTAFTAGRYPMATVVTDGSSITGVTDKRGVISVGGVLASAVNAFSQNQSVTPSTLTDGANIAVDASLSNNFKVTLAGNRTLDNPSNLTNGMVLNFRIKQDATGSRTLAYGSKYKFPGGTAPVLSTAANSVDLMSCYYDSTDDVMACVMSKGFA